MATEWVPPALNVRCVLPVCQHDHDDITSDCFKDMHLLLSTWLFQLESPIELEV